MPSAGILVEDADGAAASSCRCETRILDGRHRSELPLVLVLPLLLPLLLLLLLLLLAAAATGTRGGRAKWPDCLRSTVLRTGSSKEKLAEEIQHAFLISSVTM